MEQSERTKLAMRVTTEGVVVNFILLVVKFVAGILGRSQAMIADAIHTCSDFASDIVVYIGVKVGQRPQDDDHDYGHGKYETLAAMSIGLLLLGVGAKIGWNAIITLFAAIGGKLPEPPGMVAFLAAVISVILKEILYHRTIAVGRIVESDAVIANAWHHRSDAMSSIGSALGIGAAAFLGNTWSIMDPIAAIVVSFLLMNASCSIIKAQIDALTEKSLPHNIEAEILAIATSIPGISHPHNLRTRKVGSMVVIDLHVRVDPDMTVRVAHDAVTEIESAYRTRFGKETISNIHIEPVLTEFNT